METLVLKMHFKLFQAILANVVFLTHTPPLILTLVGGEELSFEEKIMKMMGGGSKFPPLKSLLLGWCWSGLFDYGVKPGPVS